MAKGKSVVAPEPLTQEQIADIRAKYGKCRLIKAKDGHYAVVREPRMADLELIVGALREQRAPGTKGRAWDGMRVAYKQLSVLTTEGFFDNEANEVVLYSGMEDFVVIPSGEVVEL